MVFYSSVSTCNKLYEIWKSLFEQIIESYVFYRSRVCTWKIKSPWNEMKIRWKWNHQSHLNILRFKIYSFKIRILQVSQSKRSCWRGKNGWAEGLDTTHDEGLESYHRTMWHSLCVIKNISEIQFGSAAENYEYLKCWNVVSIEKRILVQMFNRILLRNTRFNIARVSCKEIFNNSLTMIDIISDEMTSNDRITDNNSNLKP